MVRIAFLSVHSSPLATLGGEVTGGMNVYVREVSVRLGAMGHRVDVFTRAQEEGEAELTLFGPRSRLIRVPAGPVSPYPKYQTVQHLRSFVDGVRLWAKREGTHYDVIHSHYWISGLAALSLREHWKVPILQMFHTLALVKNQVARDESERERKVRSDAEVELVENVEAIVATNAQERRLLEDLYGADPQKIWEIPCGVNRDIFRPQSRLSARRALGLEAERIALFVGRLEPIKRLDVLLVAVERLAHLRRVLPDELQVVIVGGEQGKGCNGRNGRARLERMVDSLSIRDWVRFEGPIPQRELPRYYAAADICVIPSSYESFGLVALESMACGTPVVASDAGGLTFTVQNGINGYRVPVGDAAALGDRLMDVVADESRRQQLRAGAIGSAASYSWDRVARKLICLYSHLIDTAEVVPRTDDAYAEGLCHVR